MDEDSRASAIISITEEKVIEKCPYVLIKSEIDDAGSENQKGQGEEVQAVNNIEIDNIAQMEAYQREVKIDIDIDDSTEKLKNELIYKDSQNAFTKVAQRIIALDRRILMASWLVFPAFFSKMNMRQQTSPATDQSADDSTKQEAPPIDSRTRPRQNQGGYGPPQQGGGPPPPGGGYNNNGGFGGYTMQGRRGIGPEYDPYERNHFIAVVFGIVLIMLVVTAIALTMVFMIPPLFMHVRRMYLFYMIGSVVIYLVLIYCFICGPCSRNPCCGTILLIITTICMTCLAASIITRYRVEIVIYAVIATALVCGVCLLLAMSSFDFTGCLIYVVICGVVLSFLFLAVLIAKLVFHVVFTPLVLALLVASALVQAITMIIQLQMILGHRALEYDEGEYFLAAFQLYTSVIQMLITLVQILGLIDGM